MLTPINMSSSLNRAQLNSVPHASVSEDQNSGAHLQSDGDLFAANVDISAQATRIVNKSRGSADAAMKELQTLSGTMEPQLYQALQRKVTVQLYSNGSLNNASAQAKGYFENIINAQPAMPKPEGLTNEQLHDVISSAAEISWIKQMRDPATRESAQIAKRAFDNGDAVMVGFRRETGPLQNRGQGVYDDGLGVVRKDVSNPNKREAYFTNGFNTESTGQYSYWAGESGTPYANVIPKIGSNGKRAIFGETVPGTRYPNIPAFGQLRAGQSIELAAQEKYERPEDVNGENRSFALNPTPGAVRRGKTSVMRETNADGRFGAGDATVPLNDTFFIHPGSLNTTKSAGCQTIAPSSLSQTVNVLDRYVNIIPGAPTPKGKQSTINYVLIDANRI
jgi:hypothetical protein